MKLVSKLSAREPIPKCFSCYLPQGWCILHPFVRSSVFPQGIIPKDSNLGKISHSLEFPKSCQYMCCAGTYFMCCAGTYFIAVAIIAYYIFYHNICFICTVCLICPFISCTRSKVSRSMMGSWAFSTRYISNCPRFFSFLPVRKSGT